MVVFMVGGISFLTFFVSAYKPYITEIAISKANNLIQQVVNNVVLDMTTQEKYNSFTNVIRDAEQRITGIETNTIQINRFKAEFLKNVSGKMNDISLQKYKIPVLAFLNNPLLSEIGPCISIKVKPISVIKADIVSNFSSVGVNQTKHQVDMKYNVSVVVVMPAIRVQHTISSELAIAQTIIVGQVPQSYTNVTADKENFNDTVLQLAQN